MKCPICSRGVKYIVRTITGSAKGCYKCLRATDYNEVVDSMKLDKRQVLLLYKWWDSEPRAKPDQVFTDDVCRQVAYLMLHASNSSKP